MIINLTSKNVENYRCTIKNNIQNLILKFNFVTKKNFVKLINENSRNVFETIKQIFATYQNMNKTSNNLQQKLTIITINKNQFQNRTIIQKQKIDNLFTNRQKAIVEIKKLKKSLKIKKKKIIKFRKFKNVHRKNFEKIDVKVKALTINKQNLKKIVESYNKRLRKTLTKTL